MNSEKYMIELEQLEYLIKIEQEGTLSKASESLHISQPSITRSMQRLEEELGVDLFDRTKNRANLNETGKLTVQYAKSILNSIYDMEEKIKDFDQSQKEITIVSCAPAPLWRLQQEIKNPIQSKIVDSDVLLKKLKKYECNLIITRNEIKDKDVVCIPYVKESLFVSLHPDSIYSKSKGLYLHQLDGEYMLLMDGIGFWNQICLDSMPNAHFLIQTDMNVFNVLANTSTLPHFSTNLTLVNRTNNRIHIPILDKEATVQYYISYLKKDEKRFKGFFQDCKPVE